MNNIFYDNILIEWNLYKRKEEIYEKKYYYSLYDAIVRTNELSDYKYSIILDEKYLLSLNDKKKKESYELMAHYLLNSTEFEPDAKPIVFFIADEKPYDKVKPNEHIYSIKLGVGDVENGSIKAI